MTVLTDSKEIVNSHDGDYETRGNHKNYRLKPANRPTEVGDPLNWYGQITRPALAEKNL